MKSKFKYLLAFLVLSLTLVACGSNQPTDDNTSEDTEATEKMENEDTEKADESEEANEGEATNDSDLKKIVLYSNSFADEKITWLDEKAKEAGFDVEVVYISGGDLLQRILAEKNDPQADVIIGLDEGGFATIKDNDLLVEWDPVWKDEIDQDLIYGDGYFYPWSEQRIFNYYDGNQMTEDEAPKSYQDLATEENDGMYCVPGNLSSSTNQKIVFPILLSNLDENGELGVSDEGWQLVEDYYKYGRIVEAENNIASLQKAMAMVADGEFKVSYYFSGGIIKAEEEFGVHAVPINPENGVFTMAEQVGIMNRGEDADYTDAMEFAEWWGQADIQEAWSKEFGVVPANNNARGSVNPRVLEIFDQTDRMKFDWQVLNEHLDEWLEKLELDIMP